MPSNPQIFTYLAIVLCSGLAFGSLRAAFRGYRVVRQFPFRGAVVMDLGAGAIFAFAAVILILRAMGKI